MTEVCTIAEAERDNSTEGQDLEASHLGGGLSTCQLQESKRTSITPGLKTEEGKQRRVWTEFSAGGQLKKTHTQKHRFLDVDSGLEFLNCTACTVVLLIKCDNI